MTDRLQDTTLQDVVEKLGLWPDLDLHNQVRERFNEYIMYAPYTRKKRLWKCTKCNQGGVGILEGKHGDAAQCPNCGNEATLKASGKIKSGRALEKRQKILYFKEINGELFAVAAVAYLEVERQSWDGPDWTADVWFSFSAVYHWHGPGKQTECFYGGYFLRWTDRPREPFLQPFSMWEYDRRYYLFNLDEIKKTNMRYCALQEAWAADFSEEPVLDIVKHMIAYAKQPRLELVVKWGMWDIMNEFVDDKRPNKRLLDWNAKTPWEFCRLSKADFKAMQGMLDPQSSKVLDYLRAVKSWGIGMQELEKQVHRMGRDYGQWGAAALNIRDKYGLSLQEIVNYSSKNGGKVHIWRDYLDMCRIAGRDITAHNVLYPKNLKEAHDTMIDVQRMLQAERALEKQMQKDAGFMQKRYRKLCEKYEYETNGMRFIVPRGGAELIREGNILQICVGGYAGRYLDGKTDIVFLRKARRPERSYICIEIREDKIIQVHGYKNENYGDGKTHMKPRERYKAEIAEWIAWVQAGSHRTAEQKRKDKRA